MTVVVPSEQMRQRQPGEFESFDSSSLEGVRHNVTTACPLTWAVVTLMSHGDANVTTGGLRAKAVVTKWPLPVPGTKSGPPFKGRQEAGRGTAGRRRPHGPGALLFRGFLGLLLFRPALASEHDRLRLHHDKPGQAHSLGIARRQGS
jgi:hypothetical protein